jgi:hypothetical protein
MKAVETSLQLIRTTKASSAAIQGDHLDDRPLGDSKMNITRTQRAVIEDSGALRASKGRHPANR